jgi:hypothetical protein
MILLDSMNVCEFVGFEVLKAVTMKSTPDSARRFGPDAGLFFDPEDGDLFFRNVGISPNYTAL